MKMILARFPVRSLAFALSIALLTAPSLVFADVNNVGAIPTNASASSSVAAVGPNSRAWATMPNTNQLGRGATTNNLAVVEMATGMNYWDGQQWRPSDTSFQLSQGGTMAVVNATQHKVSIASDLAVSNAVSLLTPDGLSINSSPLAIGLFDAASGNTSLIGAITNCTGYFVASNQLVFSNAFEGVCANVVYTVEKGAFHQDVVITGKLDPADYGFPTNTTQIQILTEFYNPPTPSRTIRPLQVTQDQNVRNNMVSPDLVDQVLTFGQMVYGTGRAYTTAHANLSPRAGALVGKQLVTVSNRTFLIESVPYVKLQADLQSLPSCQPTNGVQHSRFKPRTAKEAYAAIPPLPTKQQAANVIQKGTERLAGVTDKKPAGVVIDYDATISSTFSGPFQSDTTYFISGTVYCSAPVTFEGGAVIKYPYAAGADIEIDSDVTFATSSYKPVVFTAGDDNTVGAQLNTGIWSGYTGTIQGNNYADPALFLNSGNAATINNIRVNYAAQGIYIEAMNNNNTWTISHSQFLNCLQGIDLDTGSCAQLCINNCLMDNVKTNIADTTSYCGNAYAFCQSTIDSTTNIFVTDNYPSFYFTNCVFLNVTNGTGSFSGNHNGFYQASLFGASQYSATSNPYQSVGAGNYYLANNSPFLNVGSTNIDPGLLSSLAQRTTYPPYIISNITSTVNVVLWPQANRDTSGIPDLGYHYDPIDFLVDTYAFTNATLTLTSGVAVACFNDSAGIWMQDGSSIVSFGTPLTPNYLLHYNTVQEQAIQIGSVSEFGVDCVNSYHYGSNGPTGSYRFTRFINLGGVGTHLYSNGSWAYSNLQIQDCEFLGTYCDFSGDTNADVMVVRNNLFERAPIQAFITSSPSGLGFSNNLVWAATVVLNAPSGGSWYAFNNSFDSCTISRFENVISNGYNAYLNTTRRLTPTNAHDYVSSTSPAYDSGPLGTFYLSSGSPLINIGSTTADAVGLFHYTTQTNQVKETNTVVDLGYHYVALNGYGQPDDYDGDGLPDYLEDTNGNGVYNSTIDLANWQAFSTVGDGVSDLINYRLGRNLNVTNPPVSDTNGLTRLQVYTPLK